MQLELAGRRAIVTGGASGIGLATIRQLRAEGCHVALWDHSLPGAQVAAELVQPGQTPPVVPITCDISDLESVKTALEQTLAALGRVEILVHAAATGSGKFGFPFTNLEPVDWRRVVDVNILGTANVAHVVIPEMSNDGDRAIVLVASVAGQIGSQTDPPYSASKAANINFAQCLAKDLASSGIRVNTVCPGMVQTPLNKAVWQSWHDQQPPELRKSYEEWADDKVRTMIPLGRWQQCDDIADMIVFLVSARARQVTGQTINVDGGFVMHW